MTRRADRESSDCRRRVPTRTRRYEAGLRPRTLDDYIGQDRIRENLQVSIAAARGRGEALDHVLLYGPPGLGKTTLAYVIATRDGRAGPRHGRARSSRSRATWPAMLTNLQAHEVLFIDEIHRMPPAIEEILYPAMEDFELDIVIGQGPGARSVKVPLQQFTLVGATTRAGLLTSPLRARFGIVHRLDFYNETDIVEIVRALGAHPGRADRRGGGAAKSAGGRAARRASPTACCAACATTRRCAPTAGSRSTWRSAALALLEVDEHGFDEVDRKLLRTIIDKFGGGPVGVNSIAAAISEETRRHRGHLRAVPDPGRLPRPHAARPRGHGARLRVFRAHAPGKDSVCGDTPLRQTVVARAEITSLATYVPPRAADQRRSREDGRDQRRVDPAAHRHPRAPHRRPGRGHVRPGDGSRAQGHRARGPHARPTSTSSSSAPPRPTCSSRAPRACCSTRSAPRTRGASTCRRPARGSPTR